MIIKSPFTDYYDHAAFLYGMPDPSVVYPREPLPDDARIPDASFVFGLNNSVLRNTYVKLIVVVGYMYLVKKRDERWRVFGINTFPEYFIGTEEFEKRTKNFGPYRGQFGFPQARSVITDRQGKYDHVAFQTCRDLKMPVFAISQFGTHGVIEQEVPKLGDYGIPSVLPPEQVFQMIEYFLMNSINESPDTMPRSEMADIDKVVSHGFDKKISFRHRT